MDDDDKNNQKLDDFLKTERTGRRNAVPDIINDKSACVSTAGISDAMGSLKFEDESSEKKK